MCVMGPCGKSGLERTKEQTVGTLLVARRAQFHWAQCQGTMCQCISGMVAKEDHNFRRHTQLEQGLLPRDTAVRKYLNFFSRLFKIFQQNQPLCGGGALELELEGVSNAYSFGFCLFVSHLLYFQNRLGALYSRKLRYRKTENHSYSDIVNK